MKKILALLMMFLISGNFLFAQVDGTTGTAGDATATVSVQPKLNFQAVVRDAQNHLVFDTRMDVVINITYGSEVYSETHEGVMTNRNGLLTVVIGGDDAINVSGDLYSVNWSNASIEAVLTFTANVVDDEGHTSEEETTITVTSDVTAVPYALQSASCKLNTDMIVDYISGIQLGTNGTAEEKRDVLLILDAIRNNEHGLKDALKDTIVKYMKHRMDIAEEIFKDYLSRATREDVISTYNAVMENPVAKQAILDVIKQFIKDHEAESFEIAEYYVEHVTTAQLRDLFELFHNNSALEAQAKVLVRHYLQEYLDEKQYVSIRSCDQIEICALSNQGMTTCPGDGFIGATTSETNEGIVTLTTVINNPNNYSYKSEYTYVLEGTTVNVEATKASGNISAEIGNLPAGTQVKLSIHFYGHDDCDLNPVVYTF